MKKHSAAKSILILAFWLCLWALLARLIGRELLLPGPLAVLRRLLTLAGTGDFWRAALMTLWRILWGAAAGVVLGAGLAVLTSWSRLLNDLLSPLLTIIRSTPVASFILLVLIWVGRDTVPSIIVILMVTPVVWANTAAGIRVADPLLLEMAAIYRFGRVRTVRRVFIPAVTPHFLSACQTSLGLAWKAGVAAEVLTVPVLSIGKRLYEAKLYLETVDLFAWTVVVVLLSLVIEKLLSAALERVKRGGARP